MFSQQATTDNASFAGRGCGGFRAGFGPFGKRMGHMPPWARFKNMFGRTPANIEETDSSFIITLYAAGLSKEGFTVQVQDDVLTITYKGKDAAEADSRYTHQEFADSSFERRFQLNGKVLAGSVSAGYSDGVMTVTLPKDHERNKPAQSINVQ